jgi:hypothetical protein
MASHPKRLLFTVIVVRTENLTINVPKCRINWPFTECMEMSIQGNCTDRVYVVETVYACNESGSIQMVVALCVPATDKNAALAIPRQPVRKFSWRLILVHLVAGIYYL